MKKIILIKLGGSLITDKNRPYAANLNTIERLAKELKNAKNPLVIAHGSGSFGHTSAALFGGKKGYKSLEGIAKVAYDAMEINRIVMDILISEKLPVVSLRPMSMLLSDRGKVVESSLNIMNEVIKQGLTPVLYGDVIWDRSWKSTIYSAEIILGLTAKYLKGGGFDDIKIIQAGITDGMLDSKGKTIPLITSKNWPEVSKHIYKVDVADVTGGMKHKIQESLKLAKFNISTFIINGTVPGQVQRSLDGKDVLGTLIK